MIAILLNEISGGGNGLKQYKKLEDFLLREDLSFKTYIQTWPDTLVQFQEIWILGGDGTINYFINKYPECKIPILIFPAGTGNDLHAEFYGEMSIEQQLKKYPEYTARSIDMGILSIDDEQEYYFLNGVGLGFDGVVLQSMQAVRRVGGHIGYLIQVIKNIFSYMEPVFQMHYDENSIYQPITLINFANCKRTGGGFLISPHADPYDGKLHIMYAYVPSKWKRLFLLHKVEKGTHILDKLVTYESATHILVKVKNKIYGQLDGELISGRKFEMKIAPQRLYVKCGGIEK